MHKLSRAQKHRPITHHVEEIPDFVGLRSIKDVPECPRYFIDFPDSSLGDDVTAGVVDGSQGCIDVVLLAAGAVIGDPHVHHHIDGI